MNNLQVTVDKLNLRNSPFADPTYANWIGDMNKGEVFRPSSIVEGKEYNGIKYWYKDAFNKYASLYGLEDNDPRIPWSLRILGVPHVWNITKGEGVKVAIIDSGIDLNNKDLSDAVPIKNRYNMIDGSANVQDSYFHGNYCASIVASRGQNGLFGVAPACELIIIKTADFGDYDEATELAGITKAIEMKADIISISLVSSQQNTEVADLLDKAMASGVICIAAAGDDSGADKVEYPANCKGMISVGNVLCLNTSAHLDEAIFKISSNSNGELSNDSDEGITIVAPGEGICVYDLAGQVQTLISGHGGTSWSTPYVAGIAALWLSAMKAKSLNNLNYHMGFKDFIISNVKRNYSDYNQKYWGYGIINPMEILKL